MIVVLVLLILGAIFLLLKQRRKIQRLKTNTDKVYRKALEEKYKNLEEMYAAVGRQIQER